MSVKTSSESNGNLYRSWWLPARRAVAKRRWVESWHAVSVLLCSTWTPSPIRYWTHWNSAGPHSERIRAGRYAVVRAAARDLVQLGQRPVLVAPFTRELTGAPEWTLLVNELSPAATKVIHVDGSPELLARRRAARGADRDAHRPVDPPARTPRIPHLRVDAELTTAQQADLVARELGLS